MPDDPIIQMAGDADFPKLAVAEQRKALAAHDPTFGKMGDADISSFVSAHQVPSPESQAPNALAQAKDILQKIPQFTSPAAGREATDPKNEYMRQSGQFAGQTAAGMATGGLFPVLKGAGILRNILPFLGRTAASGTAMAGGTLAGGGTPKQALGAAEGGALSQPIAEGTGAVLPWLAKGLKNSAIQQYERALAPTTKINKAMTQDIAPELIQRGERGSLENLENRASQKISQLSPELNTAYQQAGQLPTSIGTLPAKVVGAGNQVISDLENLKQSYRPEGITAQPQAVSAIEGIQDIVKQYGPDVSPDSLRRLRQIFEDPVAKAGGYAGADLSTNYTLAAQQQAADSIRGILNSNPNIGSLNKEISFWLDVQRVTSQSALRRTGQEGGLLKTLWPLAAGLAGGGAGFAGGGAEAGLGAAATTILATQAVKAARSPAWRTLDAVVKDRIANTLARGDAAGLSALLTKVGLANVATPRQSVPSGLPWMPQQQSGQPQQ